MQKGTSFQQLASVLFPQRHTAASIGTGHPGIFLHSFHSVCWESALCQFFYNSLYFL